MTISELQSKAHENAKAKGFWSIYENGSTMIPSDPLARAGLLMLMVSELSEAMESLRKNEPPMWQEGIEHGQKITPDDTIRWNTNFKPEGPLSELADVVIRVMDFCGAHKWSLEKAIEMKMHYNSLRPHKHGGKEF